MATEATESAEKAGARLATILFWAYKHIRPDRLGCSPCALCSLWPK
ncbi:hypothetical protein SFMTTN_1134 [Sulfuriferula multivorans]|uniref:Uncharacterized protein n=1 Tax=Sulfuriferula multivorans TaxID=1559896 RepID=A0A401JCK5_9PROT|nr:hypothetical protein SFMTTN_1134 [Sulfuriferula multivorans]